jgi:hypothetical protein
MKTALCALAAVSSLTAGTALADSLVLRNGSTLEGRLVAADRETVQFEEGDTLHMVPIEKVESIGFAPEQDRSETSTRTQPPPPPPATAAVPKPRPPAAPPEGPLRSGSPRPVAPTPAGPPRGGSPREVAPTPATAAAPGEKTPTTRRVQVPAGTRLRVKIADTLDPRRNAKGDRFSAALEVPLVAGGTAVVAANSRVYGVITSAETTGPVQNRLVLELTELTVQGRLVSIVTGTHKVLEPPTGGALPAKPAAGGARPDRLQNGTILEFRLLQPFEITLH